MMTTTIFPPFDAEKTFPLVVHDTYSIKSGYRDQARVYSVCDASSTKCIHEKFLILILLGRGAAKQEYDTD